MTRSKTTSQRSNGRHDPNDPLEKASVSLADLKDADDWDEDTARHEVSTVVHVHVPQPSQPEIALDKPQESEAPKSDDKAAVVKQVSTLTKLLPPEHRLYFLLAVLTVGSVLLALAQGWL